MWPVGSAPLHARPYPYQVPFHFRHFLSIQEPEQIAEPRGANDQLIPDIGAEYRSGAHHRWGEPGMAVTPMNDNLFAIVDNAKLGRSSARLIQRILIGPVNASLTQNDAGQFLEVPVHHGLLNPNNPMVREVLATMVQAQDHVFFAIDAGSGAATCFRSGVGVAQLPENMARIQRSTTTEAQYRRAVATFSRRPDPPGVMLDWVCREDRDYLDLTHHRLEMSPSR